MAEPDLIVFSFDDKKLQKLLDLTFEPALFEESEKQMKIFVQAVDTEVVEKRFGPTTTRTKLRVRSGFLRNSIFNRVTGTNLDNLAGRVGSIAPYAPTHEFGRPAGRPPGATGKFAALPLKAALTPAGVVRKPPRAWKNTFFAPTKKGGLVLFQDQGPKKKATPLFLMLPWDRMGPIPARLGIRDTMRKRSGRFAKALAKGLAKRLVEEGLLKG